MPSNLFVATCSSLIFYLTVFGSVSAQGPHRLSSDFDPTNIPPPPNYADINTWAAHPAKSDMADRTPKGAKVTDNQANAQADVFFVHPTLFTYQPTNNYQWNADITDETLNRTVDETTILNQASIFNGSCRVFAPRYRQAHYSAFTTEKPENKRQSLDVAYTDVREAFLYYLAHENKGRPIVIAAHSQGTLHAGRLLKEFFDGKPLYKQLVTAYLIGIATPATYFNAIPVSNTPEQVGGFTTWTTFLKGYYPPKYAADYAPAAVVNPLTWTTDSTYASNSLNSGGVGLKFNLIRRMSDAQVHRGMLWISQPRVFGRIFLRTKNWHRADMNLFWMNIRENVALRINAHSQQNR